MSRFLIPILLVAVCGFGVSCDLDPCGSTPEVFVERSRDFFEQAKAANYEASDVKWEVFDERLKELVEVCYPQHEEMLSNEADRQFWAGVSSYYVQRFGKAGAREVLRKLKGGLDGQLEKAERWLDNL